MLVEILNGYEKKGPMAAKDSKAFVTTNIINYFFGAINTFVALTLFLSGNNDPAFTFFLISLIHLSLTFYTNLKGRIWKRYTSLFNANLFAILIGYAFEDILIVQILFFVLLIGISSLLFGNKQRNSLILWFSVPFLLLTTTALQAVVSDITLAHLPVRIVLTTLGIFAIAFGLGSTILKVRQVQTVLDALLRSSSKEKNPFSSLSTSSLKLIKNNITEQENIYKLLATHSKDIILLCSMRGDITYVSPAVEAILGYQPSEVIGTNIKLFIDPSAKGLATEGTNIDFSVRTKTGNYVWLEAAIQKISDEKGAHIQTQAILRDVTEQKWLNEVLKQTTQLAHIGGWETDVVSGRSTYTDSLAELLGFKSGEIPGMPEILKLFTKESAEKIAKAYSDVYHKNISFDIEAQLTVAGHATKWARIVAEPKLENGRLHKVIGSLIDITERKRNEEALKELAMVAQYSSSGTIISDKNGLVEWVNEAFITMTGYSLEEMKGKRPAEVLQGPESDAQVRKAMNEALDSGASFRGEIIKYNKRGEAYWVEIQINPVFSENGELIKFISIENNVSERKAAETKLLEAKKNAEEGSMAKEQFLSTMTHEIRTPLNAVIGMSKILMDEDPRKDQVELLQTLHYSAENLLTLINDILDFSKISTENIQFENIPFKFNEEVAKAVHSMKFKVQERGNTIEFEGDTKLPTLLEGDLHRIVQVLNNLIGNATKFTEKGKIKVATKLLRQDNNKLWIRFSVTDNGIGLSKDKLQIIFEKFSQADASTSRKYGGTGLGLAICKMIVEQQGGKIWVESKNNQGSTFYFDIPLKTTNQSIKNDQHMTHLLESLEEIRVLTVDDNQINQLVLDRFLKKWNVTFKQASDGKEAIELANREKFDIILMDLEMPVIDGYHASHEIRGTSNFNCDTPIIALTASTRKEVEGRVYAAGMNDVMMKPFNPAHLHQLLMDYTMPVRTLHHVA
ncbi:PAS domain S-box protein [Imperialibacter roseus]|uniref:histidine kinase n=1 Tax=Imperialibacter roseus TaxID=1324217 RepID=A0ABZ0IM22_9BACT|nr:PAS domain S-box protein [Imperialibacter roseus]WOK06088.1 PAS domain S-box protein [Imperialibacter roseus]